MLEGKTKYALGNSKDDLFSVSNQRDYKRFGVLLIPRDSTISYDGPIAITLKGDIDGGLPFLAIFL